MPVIRKNEAIEKLARAVEGASSDSLVEIYTELFPEKIAPDTTGMERTAVAIQLGEYIRNGLEPEEIVDLWNVVFPEDRNVWYEEESSTIRYNEEMAGYAD